MIAIVVVSFTACDTTGVGGGVTKEEAINDIGQKGRLSDHDVLQFRSVNRNAYGREQQLSEASQSNFNKIQPPVMLNWSLERDQLNERNTRWNDPNKISYIYLMSDFGTVVGYFPIRGKVSSVNSKLTTNLQGLYNGSVVESPSMDGSYGSNGDAVFFFLTDGTYMEWSGKYLVSDNYVKLSQEPLMTYTLKE